MNGGKKSQYHGCCCCIKMNHSSERKVHVDIGCAYCRNIYFRELKCSWSFFHCMLSIGFKVNILYSILDMNQY